MAFDIYKIMQEACKSECGDCGDEFYDDDECNELEGEYEELEELDDDIVYTAEMVTVIEQTIPTGTRYLVEMDVLAKFMDSNKIEDTLKAVDQIAKSNGLSVDDMCVVVDPDDTADEIIEEAKAMKKGGKKDAFKKPSSTNKFLKMLKGKVKVLKKKKPKKK